MCEVLGPGLFLAFSKPRASSGHFLGAPGPLPNLFWAPGLRSFLSFRGPFLVDSRPLPKLFWAPNLFGPFLDFWASSQPFLGLEPPGPFLGLFPDFSRHRAFSRLLGLFRLRKILNRTMLAVCWFRKFFFQDFQDFQDFQKF